MDIRKMALIIFYTTFVLAVGSFILTGVGIWMGLNQIEKQGGLGTSIGKFINSIQDEIEE